MAHSSQPIGIGAPRRHLACRATRREDEHDVRQASTTTGVGDSEPTTSGFRDRRTTGRHQAALATAVAIFLAACAGSPGSPSAVVEPSTGPSASPTAGLPSAAPASSTATASAPEASEPAAPARWSELAVVAGPAAREDHTWTLADDGRTAFLFGGRDGATVFGDLWAFDLDADAWGRIDAKGGPAPRFGHEAAWVDGIGLVIFAGQAGTTFFDDLWGFDPARGAWTQLPSTGAIPVARYGTCMAVAPDGRLWISHGFTSDGTRFADTRAWDPATGAWTDETPDGDVPVNRCLHACWWTSDGRLALFAGQTTGVTALDDRWLLDGGQWSRVEGAQPTARNLYARGRVDDAMLVLGGQALDGSFHADGWWLLDAGGPAVPLEADGTAPPGRAGAEIVVDAERDRLLLFGGRDAGSAFADLWQLGGVARSIP